MDRSRRACRRQLILAGHNAAAVINEYSPLSSISDEADDSKLSPVSSSESPPHRAEADMHLETPPLVADDPGLNLHTVGSRPVPAKLFFKDDEHLLQIQICWACRLELCRDKQLMRIGGGPGLQAPHFLVHSWEDIANVIRKETVLETSQMIFWIKQNTFECVGGSGGSGGSASSSLTCDTCSTCATTVPCFDALCSSTAEDYAKATDSQMTLTFPVEEACLRCRRSALLPVIVNDAVNSKLAIHAAVQYKRELHTAPSTPFSARPDYALKRHFTESPAAQRPVLNLFNAIGLNEWKASSRNFLPPSSRPSASGRWSPPTTTTTITEHSSPRPAKRNNARRTDKHHHHHHHYNHRNRSVRKPSVEL